jgi:dTMP kinase
MAVELLKFPGAFKCSQTRQSHQYFIVIDRTTRIGQTIDQYLQGKVQLNDQAVHLLFSANRWEHRNRIVDLLNQGTHIVVDRYAYSGVVFSAAKGLDLKWCRAPDVGLVRPDVTLFLDVPVEIAMQRSAFGGERYETESMQRRVRELFLEMADSSWKVSFDVHNTFSDTCLFRLSTERNPRTMLQGLLKQQRWKLLHLRQILRFVKICL